MRRTVADVMTKDVVTAQDSTPFKELVALIEEHRVSALPILDHEDRLVGIVSEADLLLKEEDPRAAEHPHVFERHRRKIERAKAGAVVAAEVMTTPVITVGPQTSLAEAARLMHQRNVKRLPVLDEAGSLVGIVSRADLLRVFLRSDEDIRREIIEDVIERVLWIDPSTLTIRVREGIVELQGQVERRSLLPVLVGLVHAVEGVVGVDSRLTFEIDDTETRPEAPVPWGVLPRALRYP